MYNLPATFTFMKTAIISQARMGSSRLPGKVLLDAGNGQTLLALHLDRLKQTGLPVIVATSDLPSDDAVAEATAKAGCNVVRGPEHDVLRRFTMAAVQFDLEVVIRVTSDCPLIDPALIREGYIAWLGEDEPRLYLSNVLERSYPRGMDYEIFSGLLLAEADEKATLPAEREHVTPWMRNNVAGNVVLKSMVRHAPDGQADHSAAPFRLTVDEQADYELIRVLVENYHAQDLDVAALIRILTDFPVLAAMNAHIAQKEA